MKTLCLAMLACGLVGCETTSPVERYTQGYEMALGKPRARWTAQERAAYADGLQQWQEREERADLAARVGRLERGHRARAAATPLPVVTF